jgi:hypothetical protein
VAKSSEEIRQAHLFLKKEFWSSEIGPGYSEVLYEGEWTKYSDFLERFCEEEELPEFDDIRDVAIKGLDEEIVFKTENVWVGEVSWLKAALLEDSEKFIPSTVEQVDIACGAGKMRKIDDKMINDVKEAFKLENKTMYSLANADEVIEFLERNKGHQIFTISW